MKIRIFMVLIFLTTVSFASQTYVPPPPPKLPELLSKEMVEKGKHLFEENYWIDGKLEVHNILGRESCGSCHDQKEALKPASLAKNFKSLRKKINEEIQTRSQGEPLPIQSPMMEALVQYMVDKYKLQEFKLSK